jgi:hypothetical protein
LNRKRRLGALAAAVVLSSVLLLWIASVATQQNHQVLADLASVATVVALLWAIFVWLLDRLPSPAAPADEAVRRLAVAVERQWHAEAVVRRLLDVDPLAVEWHVVQDASSDASAGKLFGSTRDSDAIDAMADKLLRQRRRRLVVLGPPGAGKTSLAVLLTLALARRCRTDPAAPVPLLLSASTWDAGREALRDWLQRRLSEDYGLTPATALDLLSGDRVLPLVDGLDELPDDHLRAALRACNSELIADDPIVLFCRSDEYRVATRTSRALAAATVVEALPVRPADAVSFLQHALPLPDQDRWQEIRASLERSPDGPLAAALSSPLMVSLVRQVYEPADGDWAADPGQLLGFAERAALEEHLLAQAVPAAFRGRPSRGGSWRPEQAERWLGHLARHLHGLRSRDLTWWQLHRDVPLLARMAVASLAGGVLVFCNALVAVDPLSAPARTGLYPTIAMVTIVATTSLLNEVLAILGGLGLGLLFGLFLGPIAWVRTSLRRATADPLGSHEPRPSLIDWLVLGITLALVITVPLAWSYQVSYVFQTALHVFLITGGTVIVTGALADALASSRTATWLRRRGPEPAATLRRDRAGTIASSVAVTLAAIALVELLYGFNGRGLIGPGDLLYLSEVFVVSALTAALAHWWPDYVLTKCWLAATGRLPLRLSGFLDAAHQRGVLSQIGSSYRFSQPAVEDYLASRP